MRCLLSGAACAAFILGAPAGAAGATTVGSTSGDPTLNICSAGINCTYFQELAEEPVAVAPFRGVIRSWSLRSGSAGSPVFLRVLRPSGAGYTGAGRSEMRTTDTGLNTFPTRLGVQQGDVIGLDNDSSGLFFAAAGATTNIVRYFMPALPEGETGSPNQLRAEYRLLLSASIERDADGDLSSDETEDGCPVSPLSQDDCADLEIAQTVTPRNPLMGQPLRFDITITNNGPKTAQNVRVGQVVSNNANAVRPTPSQGTCDTDVRTLICELGSLASGASASVALTMIGGPQVGLFNGPRATTSTFDQDQSNNATGDLVLLRPDLTDLRVTPRIVRIGSLLPRLAQRVPLSALRFDLTSRAIVRMAFVRRVLGRRVGDRCLPNLAVLRGRPPCARIAIVGRLAFIGAGGPNTVVFVGRLPNGRALRPGIHLLLAQASFGRLRSPVRRTLFAALPPR